MGNRKAGAPEVTGHTPFAGIDNILLGDVLAVLAKVPRESAHLIVTSPPHNLEKPYAEHDDDLEDREYSPRFASRTEPFSRSTRRHLPQRRMTMPRKHLLLSVRPQHARGIFAGTKTVELRRRRPRVQAGDTVWVYASSPQKALLGTFQVADVISGAPDALWERVGAFAAVTRETFDAYYEGTAHGCAIVIDHVRPLGQALPLAHLRERVPGFQPPQSYRYLDGVEAWLVSEAWERRGAE